MANYGALLTRANASTTLGVGAIYCPASGQRRVAIYDLIFGSQTAGDTQFTFTMQRITAAPTGNAVTPDPLDTADPAAVTLAAEELSNNGTVTAGVIPFSMQMNQRSTFRWVAKDGKEIIVPASAGNGVDFLTPTALLTPPAQVMAYFNEL